MVEGTLAASDRTGFVPAHADAVAEVARRVGAAIMFREPGLAARGLIEDNYAMKGFRIDTKSCNWGPMRGFVCVDPRLSKARSNGNSYIADNAAWTEDALRGKVDAAHFGEVSQEDSKGWQADVMPIVISKARLTDLIAGRHITAALHQGGGGGHFYHGVSEQRFGDGLVSLPWRLMPARGATNPWLAGASAGDYYVLCVEPKRGFVQRLPGGVQPILFRGLETVLGMCNPGSRSLGFRACVTADYDLFAVWPRCSDTADARHGVAGAFNTGPLAGGGIPRLLRVDQRPLAHGLPEHFRAGNVSARIMSIKVMLNGAIIGAGYRGGNAVQHSDELGNVSGLAKGTLADCLPVLACVPWRHIPVLALESAPDFRQLVREAGYAGYAVQAKSSWLNEAGVRAA